jgi:hypothetical protein
MYEVIGSMGSRNNEPSKPLKMDSSVTLTPSGSLKGDPELIEVILYHIYNRFDKKIFTIARNYSKDTLFEMDWEYFIEGHLFYPLIFNEIPATDDSSNSYPLSDVTPMLPQLKDLAKINEAIMRHGKRAGTLLLAKEGLITESQAAMLQSSHDLDLILLKDLSEANLRGFTPPSLPQDWYNIRNLTLEDLMRISGYTQLLGMAKGVDTATESENIRAGALIRQLRKIDIIEDFTVDIARGLAGLIWQYKNKQQIEEIIGEPVSEDMFPTLPDDPMEARRIVQKELQFKIDAGSTRPPKDEFVERKMWQNEASIIKANFPTRIKEDELLRQWLKKAGYKDLENLVISSDQEEVAAAQQENGLLAKEMIQVVSPNENHQIHLQVHSQLAQTPGLQPTQALDEHILAHNKFFQMKMPMASPQKGDSRLPIQSGNPEIVRQGAGTYSDMVGGVRGSVGTGSEKGGK